MAKAAGAQIVQPRFGAFKADEFRVVLEGGSIDVNGRGMLLTTEECLLSTTQQRNPHMNRAAYEQMFGDISESSRSSGSARVSKATTRTGMLTI